MDKVSESIYDGDSVVVALADVQHVEKLWNESGNPNGIWVITSHTRYNFEHDMWDNPAHIPEDKAEGFMKAWYYYRYELDNVKSGV